MMIKFLGPLASHLDVQDVHGAAEGLTLQVALGELPEVGVEALDDLVLSDLQHLITKLLVLFLILLVWKLAAALL